MSSPTIQPTGVERTFGEDDIIVSKTDTKGKLTYVNQVFLEVSGYTEREMLGQPHNVIRHPDMPRCIFKLLWETIEDKREIFAYVINMAKNGDHYWVLAHVTPTFDARHNIIGFHSNRRFPKGAAVRAIERIYRQLREEERKYPSVKDAMAASTTLLHTILEERHLPYEEFVLGLARQF